MIIRVFRSLIPEFINRADIRELICQEVLMASIDVSTVLVSIQTFF